MHARIVRWGHGLGLRIPKSLAADPHLGEGTPVDVGVVQGDLVVRPLRYSIEELVAGTKPENVHAETGWGDPVGREVW